MPPALAPDSGPLPSPPAPLDAQAPAPVDAQADGLTEAPRAEDSAGVRPRRRRRRHSGSHRQGRDASRSKLAWRLAGWGLVLLASVWLAVQWGSQA